MTSVAPLVDGDIADRALVQLEARLVDRTRPGATESERDRLRRAIAEDGAERAQRDEAERRTCGSVVNATNNNPLQIRIIITTFRSP